MWRILLLMSLTGQAALGETYGQRVLAAVLLSEAATEGTNGMTAVAEVIRTRADHWNVTPLAVVKRNRDFACLRKKDPDELVRKFELSKKWPQALAIARLAYNHPERFPGLAKGATHYHSGKASWAKDHQPVATIGRLKFYKLPLDRGQTR